MPGPDHQTFVLVFSTVILWALRIIFTANHWREKNAVAPATRIERPRTTTPVVKQAVEAGTPPVRVPASRPPQPSLKPLVGGRTGGRAPSPGESQHTVGPRAHWLPPTFGRSHAASHARQTPRNRPEPQPQPRHAQQPPQQSAVKLGTIASNIPSGEIPGAIHTRGGTSPAKPPVGPTGPITRASVPTAFPVSVAAQGSSAVGVAPSTAERPAPRAQHRPNPTVLTRPGAGADSGRLSNGGSSQSSSRKPVAGVPAPPALRSGGPGLGTLPPRTILPQRGGTVVSNHRPALPPTPVRGGGAGHVASVRQPPPSEAKATKWVSFPPVGQEPTPDFPIDVVVLWVDGTDAKWRASAQATFKAELSRWPGHNLVHSAMREPEPLEPGQKDEMHYGAMLVGKFMPWVRTYHIVSAKPQVPAWVKAMGDSPMLGTSTNIRIAFHEDIWAGPGGVTPPPTFNSNHIQANLHNIPDLAEHFILFDDDMFVGQPLKRTDFFTPEGFPAVRTHALRPSGGGGAWAIICRNTHQVVLTHTGITNTNIQLRAPEHVACASLRSWWKYLVEELEPARIAEVKRFRGKADVCIHYAIIGLLAARDQLRSPGSDFPIRFCWSGGLAGITSGGRFPGLFCINDRINAKDRALLDGLLESK